MWWFRDKFHVVSILLFFMFTLFSALDHRLSAVVILAGMFVYFVVELGWGGGTMHDWSHRPKVNHRHKRSGRP